MLEFGLKTKKPVVIVAPDFKSDALTSLVVNHLQNKIKVVAVKTPQGSPSDNSEMSILEDLAAFSGARVLSKLMGDNIGKADPVHVLGKVQRVQIDNKRTILIGGHGSLKQSYQEKELSKLDKRLI